MAKSRKSNKPKRPTIRERVAYARRLAPLILAKHDLVEALEQYSAHSFYDYGNDVTMHRITIRNDHHDPKPHVHVALGEADASSTERTGKVYITWNDYIIPEDTQAPVFKRVSVEERDLRTRRSKMMGMSLERGTQTRAPDELDARADSIVDLDEVRQLLAVVKSIPTNYRLLSRRD